MKKEDYMLWREYLTRSDKYKRFCQLIGEGHIPDKTARENRRLAAPDKKILLDEHLIKTWEFFGDVFNEEFENWWPPKIPEKLKPVVELGEAIKKPSAFMLFYINRFFRKTGRNPSIQEFADFSEYDFVYVRIRMTDDVTMKDIVKEINAIKKSTRKVNLMRPKEARSSESLYDKRYHTPTGKIYHTALNGYLNIYDLKKKNLKWDEIIEQHPLPLLGVKKSENRKRTYLLYNEKAVKIIQNVEEGYFPGNYE